MTTMTTDTQPIPTAHSMLPVKSATWLCVLFLLAASSALGQNSGETPDVSKPTNLYSLFQNSGEWIDRGETNLFGYRASFAFATRDQNNLLLAEVPLLYNDGTSKFGLGDIRLRYFGILYKDYTKLFGAFAPSVDLFMPTGRAKNGLGSDRWTISPGVATGLIFNKRFQTFPIFSYVYTSAPQSEGGTGDFVSNNSSLSLAQLAVAGDDDANHGISVQSITVLNFTSWFLWVTPIYVVPDIGKHSLNNQFILEVRPSTTIGGKYQIGAFYRRNFETKVNTLRFFLALFF